MDIVSFLAVLWRRRWVVIPALLVVAGLVVGVSKIVKPTYKATSTVVLYAPTVDPNATPAPKAPAGPTNPLLGVNGLHSVTDVMVAHMVDPVVVKQMGDIKGWTVTNVDGSATPLMIVTATEKTPEGALATVDRLNTLLEQQLVQLQLTEGRPPTEVIHSRVVQKDTEAVAVHGSKIRAMVGTLVLGLILAISLAFAVEAIASSRTARSPRKRGKRRPRPEDGARKRNPANKAPGRPAEKPTESTDVAMADR